MFDSTSRYAHAGTKVMTVVGPDGKPREVRYIERRFIPSGEDVPVLAEHTVSQGERLDNVTALYLSDPTLFWRICDANNVLSPDELTDEIGARIKITLPNS